MEGSVPALRLEGFQGIDQHWTTRPDRTLKIQDARWDLRGGWERCGGTAKILLDSQGASPFAGQGKVNSLFWFSQHNGGPQYLLFEMDSNLVYFNGSISGAAKWTVLKTDRYTTSQPWQHTQYNAMGNNCWILNGENGPLRFDGRTCHKAGFDGPAPGVTVQAVCDGFAWGTSSYGLGLGTPPVGNKELIAGVQTAPGENGFAEYAYVLTEENEFGTESPPSTIFGAARWTVNQSEAAAGLEGPRYFACVNVPLPSGDHVVRRRLWRTQNTYGQPVGDARTFYLHSEIAGQGAFSIVDGKPDIDLGVQLIPANYGPWPKGAKYMAFYKGCAFYAGMPEYPDRLVYSRAGDPENVPPANYFNIGSADSGEITGMRETRNALVVYKRRGIFMVMIGDGTTEFTVKTITKEVGCASPNTIRDVPGIGQVFVSDEGIYSLVGSIQQGDVPPELRRISEPLADWWDWKVNRTALLNACSEVYHEDRELWFSLPMGGVPDNKMVLVYHYDVGAWSFRPNLNAACLAESHDHRGYLFIGSNADTTHPGVHTYSRGFSTKDGTAINFQLQTAWLDLQGVYRHFIPERVALRVLTYGTNSLTLTAFRDRVATEITTNGQNRQQIDPDYTTSVLPVWDTATWNTTQRWAAAQPTAFAISVGQGDGSGTCKEFMAQVSSSSRIQVLGMEIQTSPTPDTPVMDAVVATGSEL